MTTLMIPQDILNRLTKDDDYKRSLKEFMETPMDDGDEMMLDMDNLRRSDTWNELADKEL